MAKRLANNLDGKNWLRNSISIWDDVKKSKEEKNLKHPAIFPIALAKKLIQCFTNEESKVIFDPFMGSGSTLIAAQELGKDAIGIDISPEFSEVAEKRLKEGDIKTAIKIHTDDSRKLDHLILPNSVDMVITSPPYWDILLQKRTVRNNEQRDYGNPEDDLGKIDDYASFVSQLYNVFSKVYKVMKPRSYCCVIVMDIRKKSKFYPYHIQVSQMMEEIGFIFDDIIIWDRREEYHNLKPLGYPSVFRINKVHEFILIFQKPE